MNKGLEAGKLMKRAVAIPALAEYPEDSDQIIGKSKAMQEVYKMIGQVAESDVTVLIRGESGTGKELVARAIYQHSRRKGGPFLAINCAAIPETLLESELFGYEKGAFTGANRRRIGKFEQCHQGTILLDEVGDMSLTTQAKILRVLQEGKFERIGGNETIKVNVRVLASTHRKLEEMIKQGTFREDLYYRLKIMTITLPPLRERKDDIQELDRILFSLLQPPAGRPGLLYRSFGFRQVAVSSMAGKREGVGQYSQTRSRFVQRGGDDGKGNSFRRRGRGPNLRQRTGIGDPVGKKARPAFQRDFAILGDQPSCQSLGKSRKIPYSKGSFGNPGESGPGSQTFGNQPQHVAKSDRKISSARLKSESCL